MSGQALESEIAVNSGNVRTAAVLMREIRLGLVCYGGVSLAIYMHGVTRELHKLIRAARAFERAYEALGGHVPEDEDPDPWLAGPAQEQAQGAGRYDSERAYFAALAALAARGAPLTVTLDVIAGTSAGGINGVCLARALAEGRSLDGFRNLWLEHAGIEELLGRARPVPVGPAEAVVQAGRVCHPPAVASRCRGTRR